MESEPMSNAGASTQQAPVVAELDARHLAAMGAFSRRDLDAYRQVFSPTLAYQQADGRIITRDQLMRDVARQFRRLSHVKASFVRERMSIAGDEATELLVQEASLEATAFGVVHRSWRLTRRGDYVWTKLEGLWVIQRVKVFSETVLPAGWRFGFGSPDA
jgi:hypothetical protein